MLLRRGGLLHEIGLLTSEAAQQGGSVDKALVSTSACVTALRLLVDLVALDRNPDASQWLATIR